MTQVIVHGFQRSTYVNMVRLVLTHKNVPFAFNDLESVMGTPAHLALHPFNRVPILEHDGFRVYETIAIITRITRSEMLSMRSHDHVRTARAKGLPEWRVVLKHVLRNALIPVVTVLGLQLGTLIGGAVITEYVFALPGVGRLVVDAVFARDYPLVQGVVLLIAVGFIVSNLLVDVLYGLIDPRIRG